MLSSQHEQVLRELQKRAADPAFLAVMRSVQDQLPSKVTYRDYSKGLQSVYQHICAFIPEVLDGGMRIVDVGTGVGTFMVLARALGNTVVGEDIDSSSTHAYQQITSWWNLSICYRGFHEYLAFGKYQYTNGEIDLFHFRGSMDGLLCACSSIERGAQLLMELLWKAVAPHGRVWIGHNQEAHTKQIVDALRKHRGQFIPTVDTMSVTELLHP